MSGQTGSPECVGARSCICDTLYGGGALLRVQGESAADGRLVAVVDEVLGDVYGETDVRAGDRVGGDVTARRPCAPEDEPKLEGAELFVLFYPGNDGGYPGCDSPSPEVCDMQRSAALLNGGFSFAIPWEDELDFGAEHRLSSSDVAALSSPESCWERFPLEPPPPCDDSRGNCSVVPAPVSSSPWPWAGVVGGMALVGWARRSRSARTKACG